MTKNEFNLLLDQLLEFDPGTIRGDELLKDIPKWDSLAVMGFIALLDQQWSITVPASDIIACATVADLAKLTGNHVQ